MCSIKHVNADNLLREIQLWAGRDPPQLPAETGRKRLLPGKPGAAAPQARPPHAPQHPCLGARASFHPLSPRRRLELNGIKSIPPGAFSPYKKLRRM